MPVARVGRQKGHTSPGGAMWPCNKRKYAGDDGFSTAPSPRASLPPPSISCTKPGSPRRPPRAEMTPRSVSRPSQQLFRSRLLAAFPQLPAGSREAWNRIFLVSSRPQREGGSVERNHFDTAPPPFLTHSANSFLCCRMSTKPGLLSSTRNGFPR